MILMKSNNNSGNYNEDCYDNLLKMFNRYCVPIKTIDFSMPSLNLNINQLNSSKIIPDIESILNTVINEIELSYYGN
jgi:hypothetical protein